MFYNLRQNINRGYFNFLTRSILSTNPLVFESADLVILSMISHLDLFMYLIAIKSLYKVLKKGRIVVLNDGSLSLTDINILKKHIPFLEVIHIAEIRSKSCPKGACWERLLLIADYVKDNYVIQIDADSLVLNNIIEVTECVTENKSFALGQPYFGLEIAPMSEIVKNLAENESKYIEIVAEKMFFKLDGYKNLKYCRSSACFAGFAKNSFSKDNIEDFSFKMNEIMGNRWTEWGTEKITSNYILANSPKIKILPFPNYVSYYADKNIKYEQSCYLHFTGTHRFMNGFYIKCANKVIKNL